METTRGSLIARIKDLQDTQAWSEFDTIYRPILRRYARSCGLDASGEEDLVQQCLESVARNIRAFEYDPGRCRFRSWLLTIVESRVKNLSRRQRPMLAHTDDLHALLSTEPSPTDVFERIWLEEHLRYCFEQLRAELLPSTVQAYEMYVLQQRSVEEVCDTLGLKRAQLYNIKFRVTELLRLRLLELLGEEETL